MFLDFIVTVSIIGTILSFYSRIYLAGKIESLRRNLKPDGFLSNLLSFDKYFKNILLLIPLSMEIENSDSDEVKRLVYINNKWCILSVGLFVFLFVSLILFVVFSN